MVTMYTVPGISPHELYISSIWTFTLKTSGSDITWINRFFASCEYFTKTDL